jgi:hypothetical protein
MRLQLALVLFAVLLCRGDARAAGQAAGWISVYADDDDLTVISPQVAVEHDVADQLNVALGYDVDIISAATVDVRTAASPRGYDEVRHGAHAALTWKPQTETSLGISYSPSFETDYESHGVGSSMSHEWYNRALTTSVSLLVLFNEVGRRDESRATWRSLTTAVAGVEQGIVLDQFTLATLAYELQVHRGFMASPYRFAEVHWPDGTSLLVPEAVPEQRTRHAGRAGLRRALTRSLFIFGAYRFYGDDWGVRSHTGDVELQYGFWRELLIASLRFRGYHQSAADFYRQRHVASVGALPATRTTDKMLAEGWSVLGDLQLELNLSPLGSLKAMRVAAGVGIYDQHFVDFAPLEARQAVLASFGVTAEY